MNNVVATLMTGLAILTFGMPSVVAAQNSPRQTTGKVLTVNRDAQALTVKSITPDGREIDSVFSVQEAAARDLADLRPGEMVRITYVQVNGQLRAQRIVKAPDSAPKQ